MKNRILLTFLLCNLLGNIYLAINLFSDGPHLPSLVGESPTASSQNESTDRVAQVDVLTAKERATAQTSVVSENIHIPEAFEESNAILLAGYENSRNIQADFQHTGDPVADITRYLSSSAKVLPTVEMARAYLKEERSAEQRSYFIENLGRSDLPDATDLIINLYNDEIPSELQSALCAEALIQRNTDSAKATLMHYFENSDDSNLYIKLKVAMHLTEKFQDANADAFLKDFLQSTTDDFYREIIEIFYKRRDHK